MEISHFAAILIFSLCVSVVFALTSKEELKERIRYGIWSFFSFVLVAVAMGWLMFPFPHR